MSGFEYGRGGSIWWLAMRASLLKGADLGVLMGCSELNWQAVNEARLAGMSPSGPEREQAESALCHLRSVFGDDLRAVPNLVLRNLLNMAPWTYVWLDWLSESLLRLSSAAGIDSLNERLADPKRFMEAYSVLQAAERLHTVGFEICIDIPVLVGPGRKVPDLQVRDIETGTMFSVEVSALFISARQAEDSAVFDQVSRQLLDVAFAGRFLSLPADDDVLGIANRVGWERLEMERCPGLREIALPGVLELAIAPVEDMHIVRQWAAKRGLELGSFTGPPSEVDLGFRFQRKVAEKVKQLPAERSNLLVIPAHELFICVGNPLGLRPLLHDSISNYPQVAAVVVSSEWLNHADTSLAAVDEDQLATSNRLGVAQQFLVVSNPSANKWLERSTREKVWRAFAL